MIVKGMITESSVLTFAKLEIAKVSSFMGLTS